MKDFSEKFHTDTTKISSPKEDVFLISDNLNSNIIILC